MTNKKLKNTYRYIFQTLGFVVLTVLILMIAAKIVERKDSRNKYAPFFEQKEDFDVLFYGSSHMINGVFPMELWDDYGIVSYNWGGHSNQIPVSYWVMRNTLDYTNPELVVVDCVSVGEDGLANFNASHMHQSFDCLPVSLTKIRAIYDLCPYPELVDCNGENYYKRKWEYIWDFGKYHGRWSEVTLEELSRDNFTKQKGAEARIGVEQPIEAAKVPNDAVLDNDTVGTQYLRKLLAYCQDKGIEVLLVYIPYPAKESGQIEANSVQGIADEYGVNYINFLNLDVVDLSTDCYDADSHLNPSGARKVTAYIGEYIKNNYDIIDRRDDQRFVSWKTDFDEYLTEKKSFIENEDSIENVLMLLKDDDLKYMISVEDENIIQDNRTIANLLSNIKWDYDKDNVMFVNDDVDKYIVKKFPDYGITVFVER